MGLRAALLLCFMTGCATTQPEPPPPPKEKTQFRCSRPYYDEEGNRLRKCRTVRRNHHQE